MTLRADNEQRQRTPALLITEGETYPMVRERHDEYVAQEFNRAAKGYDDSRLVKSYQRRVQALVVNELQLEKGMNVLDLGCGTGWATLEIASRLEGTGKVIGLDLSEGMIEQAKRKLEGFRYDNVEFVWASASLLDYDGYFDYVLSTNAFHHFADKGEVFFRVWRSLKHNGSFLIQDICDDYILMKALDFIGKVGEKAHVGSTTSHKLRELLIVTGFSDVQVRTTKLNWFWGIMIGKGVK
jgi:ubiquinone/menaquinone biosynthesis C-methylase UbiE